MRLPWGKSCWHSGAGTHPPLAFPPQEEETKRLLEPAASPPNKVLNGAEQSYHNLPSARTDEQAMLSSILAKTAM